MYPNIIPGLLTSMVCAAFVRGSRAFWSILRKRAGNEAKGRLARRHSGVLSGCAIVGYACAFEGLSGLGRPPQHSA